MRVYYGECWVAFVALAMSTGLSLWADSNTSLQFPSLCHYLGLSELDTQLLTDRLSRASTSNDILDIACMTAQYSLGEDRVDTTPLNQTLVRENWSSACISQPYCIIQPTEAQHVSVSLRIITLFEVKFSIRSGGHSPNPGWSSVGKDGILLDMSRMNRIAPSDDGYMVSVGPGSRWGDVVAAVDVYNVTVVAGRDPSVGVAGLVLGGGYSHLTPKFGLVADNVKNFEVVLADGTITDANINTKSDLFWALKGGGPNFGVITRLDLTTVPVSEIWLQLAVYSPDQALEILDMFVEWQTKEDPDHKSTIGLVIGLDSVTVGLVYFEPSPSPAPFSSFFDLTPLQLVVPPTNTTLTFLNSIFSSAFPSVPMRHDYRGVSSRIDSQLYKDVYGFWLQSAQAARAAAGTNQTFVIQHVPLNVAQQGRLKGGNPIALPLENHQWWTTTIDWVDENDDEIVRSVSIDTVNQWEVLSQERGLDIPFIYMNDASREQDPLTSYGAENVDRLKQVSQKYDPQHVFQTLQNDGFLLSKNV